MKRKLKTALIIGSNGYLGKHLVLSLNNYFHLRLADKGPLSNNNIKHYIQIDISQPQDVKKLDLNVDYIFVFSGLTGTTISLDNYFDFIAINEIGLLNILHHHKESNSNARIVFPSTRLVYKGITDKPIKEDGVKEFKTIYALNKFACENFLRLYQDYYKIDYTVYRICVPYGNMFDDSASYGTMGTFLDRAKSGKNIILYGDGSQKRTFTHVKDICDIIAGSVQLSETRNEVFNIGSLDNLSLREVAGKVAEKYNVKVEYVDWPEKALAIESGDTIFDSEKLEKLHSFSYHYKLIDWLNGII